MVHFPACYVSLPERTQNLIMKKSSTIIHASNFAKEGNSMDFSGVVVGAGALLENLRTWSFSKKTTTKPLGILG